MSAAFWSRFIKDELIKRGYQPVYTPHIGRLELYRTCGHFPYYRDAQFPPMYSRPAAGGLDLCQYRLSLGELDEKKEQEFQTYHEGGPFRSDRIRRAETQEASSSAIHHYALELLRCHARRFAGLSDRQGRTRPGPTRC